MTLRIQIHINVVLQAQQEFGLGQATKLQLCRKEVNMKLIESWRFAIRCMKLSYNLKMNLICGVVVFVIALVQEIANHGYNGIGAMLLMTVAMYPAQMIYSICGSQLVQSSPYKKSIMTSLTTVITFCGGILYYLLVIGIEGIRVIVDPEAAGNSARIILFAGMLLMLIKVYVSVVYRYFFVSVIVMVGSITIYFYLFTNNTIFSQWLSEMSMPAAIIAGLCFAVLGSLLQYGISLLLYKKPISRSAIYGMLRQQA